MTKQEREELERRRRARRALRRSYGGYYLSPAQFGYTTAQASAESSGSTGEAPSGGDGGGAA